MNTNIKKMICSLMIIVMTIVVFPNIPAKAAYYNVNATKATNVTSSNATVYGKISYSGTKPQEIGVLLGRSSNIGEMTRACYETPTHNLKSYNVWYNLTAESNPHLTLTPGTTYFYRFYVRVNGVYYYSNAGSFTTSLVLDPVSARTVATKSSGAMHTQPYGDAPITSRLNYGESLEVWNTSVNSYGNTWYLVSRPGQSQKYWVVGDYLALNETRTTNVYDTYLNAIKIYNNIHGTNLTSLGKNGCVNTAWYQLMALGIVASKDRPAIGATWNGKDFYRNYRTLELRGNKTDTGYSFKTYSGLSGFKQLVNEYNNQGKPVYNILVSFSKAGGSTQYGHVVFIHAIINGKVYFTDNYSGWFANGVYVREGATNIVTVEQFITFYSTYNGSFNGAVHFYR